jgi:Ca2+-binding EF-hand superfamily protein
MFDRFANGKEVWVRADANNPWGQGMFDQITQALNITNGQITREQFTTYMQQQRNNGGGFRGGRRGNNGQGGAGSPPGNAPAPGTPGAGPGGRGNGLDQWAENWFRRLDANGDGLLNYDEMPESLRVERDKWDTNKDGFIDLNEFKAYFQAAAQQRMAENGGWNPNWQGGDASRTELIPFYAPPEEEVVKKAVVYHAGNLPKDIPDWFKQLDSDGDGQIGLYEWKAGGKTLDEFRKIDRNNDGFLTIDEVMRYVAEQKKAGGPVSPSPGGGIVAQNPGNGQGFGRRPAFNGSPGRNGSGNRTDRSGGN